MRQDVLDFYNQNKFLQQSLKKLPINQSKEQIIYNLLTKDYFGWLELDLRFNQTAFQRESNFIKQYLFNHRDEESVGWQSCCLHGLGISNTENWNHYGYKQDDQSLYNWTDLASLVPTIKKFCESLPFENFKRIRFMNLKAGGYILPHSDMPGYLPGESSWDPFVDGIPINLAICHPSACKMVVENFGIVPWDNGKIFSVNIKNFHSVINFSNEDRLHLIIHGIPGNKKNDFCDLLIQSYEKQYKCN